MKVIKDKSVWKILSTKDDTGAAVAVCEQFDLSDLQGWNVSELSGGELHPEG